MAETAVIKKRYTYQDYLKLPEDANYELIEGELAMTPSPKTDHQWISGEIGFALRKFVKENNLGKIFDAPFDVYLDDATVVQPDILYISKERQEIITEDNIRGGPDLVVEILSESTAYRDAFQKKILYARFGVKEYWIVAPKETIIEQYILKNSEYALARTWHREDTLESQVLSGFRMELKEIFEAAGSRQ